MSYIYRFRVLSDENEEFIRDIEIRNDQNFFDLHCILVEALGLSGEELASIFFTNSQWEKQKEFTIMDMMQDLPGMDALDKADISVHVMEEELIKDHIEDPHQRLIYEYDFLNPKLFFLELTDLSQAHHRGLVYPRISYSQGSLKQNTDRDDDQSADRIQEIENLRNPEIFTDIQDIDDFLSNHYDDLFDLDNQS